jgi:uncharacterized membrane protein (DUF2068 family)
MVPTARPGLLRLIAVFKLLKALVLVTVVVAGLHLLHHQPAQTVLQWVLRLHVDPGNSYVRTLLAKLLSVNEEQVALLAGGTLLYALLFTIEGVGLWLERAWAEDLTILSTAGFLPIELYELIKQSSITKEVVLLLNVIIVLYLAVRMRQRRRE